MHGFYAIMGGLAFEIPSSESKKFMPSGDRETWFLNSAVVKILSKYQEHRRVLPNLSQEEIKSKSKSNGLGKGLVCIQALWFIAQCITRRT